MDIPVLNETDDRAVIKAYAISLRVTFLGCAFLAVILCFLLLPVPIPDLPETKSEEVQSRDDDGSRGGEGSR